MRLEKVGFGKKRSLGLHSGVPVLSTQKMRALHVALTQINFALLWYTVSGDFLRCGKPSSFLSHMGSLQPRRGLDTAAFMAPTTWPGLKRSRLCKTTDFLKMKTSSTAHGQHPQGANNQVPSGGAGRKKHAEGSKGKKVFTACLHKSLA
jgi:hypothetical protein